MNIFIIDNEIAFLPDERKLLCLKNMSEYTIHRASERCLTLLIERQGRVITHNELMVVGWGEDALRTISTASYYQAFVNLRKAFKKLGYKNKLFVTIRGEGIRLNSYIDIRKEDVLPSNGQLLPTDTTPEDIKSERIFYNPDESNLGEKIQNKTISMIHSLFFNKIMTSNFRNLFILITLSLMLSMIVFFISFNNEIKIPGFIQDSQSPACFQFNKNNKSNKFSIDFLSKKGFSCDTQKKYYVSYFHTSPRLTVFICDNNHSSFNCEAETYIVHE
ncbi:winged helix-turn-helix domain-containing protein [Klebsiella oxytoca]|uniref:winged helix-turn-helix domain-containing protein n=1 Tax=Klebsiella oxytoca TaxID=571 RepID=UPI0022475C3C|nr:winged helix-turn-helix domain-containing protein [Klebsiella oxytoca]MCW9445978.1 winged helix-turn-helix domain-containing protein [Klebsiella oxytoca]